MIRRLERHQAESQGLAWSPFDSRQSDRGLSPDFYSNLRAGCRSTHMDKLASEKATQTIKGLRRWSRSLLPFVKSTLVGDASGFHVITEHLEAMHSLLFLCIEMLAAGSYRAFASFVEEYASKQRHNTKHCTPPLSVPMEWPWMPEIWTIISCSSNISRGRCPGHPYFAPQIDSSQSETHRTFPNISEPRLKGHDNLYRTPVLRLLQNTNTPFSAKEPGLRHATGSHSPYEVRCHNGASKKIIRSLSILCQFAMVPQR